MDNNIIHSRNNSGTDGYIPRLKHDRAYKGWNLRLWKKVLRASK